MRKLLAKFSNWLKNKKSEKRILRLVDKRMSHIESHALWESMWDLPKGANIQEEQLKAGDSYKLGNHTVTLFGQDYIAMKADMAHIDMLGREARRKASKRGEDVIKGLREAHVDTEDELSVAEAISKLKKVISN